MARFLRRASFPPPTPSSPLDPLAGAPLAVGPLPATPLLAAVLTVFPFAFEEPTTRDTVELRVRVGTLRMIFRLQKDRVVSVQTVS